MKNSQKESFGSSLGRIILSTCQSGRTHEKILDFYPLLVYPRAHSKPSEFDDHPKIKMIEAPINGDLCLFYKGKCQKGLVN